MKTLEQVDLEELFGHEIPCGTCSKPARFRSLGHAKNDCGRGGIGRTPPPFYKCLDCLGSWTFRITTVIRSHGVVGCGGCTQLFTRIEDFSNYREF